MQDYSVTTIDSLPQLIEELKGEDEDSANSAA